MSKGQLVTVRLYGGQTAPRRVLDIKRDIVVVCSEEEFKTAQVEGRDPHGLGFPKADVLSPQNGKGSPQ